jgi:hypothetical protein
LAKLTDGVNFCNQVLKNKNIPEEIGQIRRAGFGKNKKE